MRLIDANLFNCAVEFVQKHLVSGDSQFLQGYEAGLRGAVNVINELPTVDAVEVVHGRWQKAHIAGYLKCNRCEDAFIYEEWLESGKWSYCPNCGAKMDGGNEDG